MLLKDCQHIANTMALDDVYQEPFTKSRNRLESRQVSTFFYPLFTHLQYWDLVKVVVKVVRHKQRFDTKSKKWKVSVQVAYYISTIALSAEAFCETIRHHWGIENRNHYVRDVTLGEDASRIRVNPHIFSTLRSFALNILRKNKVDNVSVALFDNCMNFTNVLNYVGIL